MTLLDIVDPDFRYASSSSLMWVEMAVQLAEEDVIPVDVSDLASQVQAFVIAANLSYGDVLLSGNVTLGNMGRLVAEWL